MDGSWWILEFTPRLWWLWYIMVRRYFFRLYIYQQFGGATSPQQESHGTCWFSRHPHLSKRPSAEPTESAEPDWAPSGKIFESLVGGFKHCFFFGGSDFPQKQTADTKKTSALQNLRNFWKKPRRRVRFHRVLGPGMASPVTSRVSYTVGTGLNIWMWWCFLLKILCYTCVTNQEWKDNVTIII